MKHSQEATMNLSARCPVCDAFITPEEELEESEILSCPDCHTMLVVDGVDSGAIRLSEAPQIEEDWGE